MFSAAGLVAGRHHLNLSETSAQKKPRNESCICMAEDRTLVAVIQVILGF